MTTIVQIATDTIVECTALVTWNSHFEKRALGIPGIPGNRGESKGIEGNPGNPRLWREAGTSTPYIDYMG